MTPRQKPLCIVCREEEATLPDRNQIGRHIKRVCRACHLARLQDDLKRILEGHNK